MVEPSGEAMTFSVDFPRQKMSISEKCWSNPTSSVKVRGRMGKEARGQDARITRRSEACRRSLRGLIRSVGWLFFGIGESSWGSGGRCCVPSRAHGTHRLKAHIAVDARILVLLDVYCEGFFQRIVFRRFCISRRNDALLLSPGNGRCPFSCILACRHYALRPDPMA